MNTRNETETKALTLVQLQGMVGQPVWYRDAWYLVGMWDEGIPGTKPQLTLWDKDGRPTRGEAALAYGSIYRRPPQTRDD